ncbi:MAG TPA: ATP-binding protein [Rhizomicrobium sp.]|jgi:signal transduction histidine kinase|nr:ATP-binding protein [Rhizomicrobium sp.]
MITLAAWKGAARLAALTAVTFAGFFLLGYGGILIAGGNSNQASPVWPATAFGLCLLLRLSRSRKDDIAMFAAILAAGLLANGLGHATAPLVIGFSFINVLDVLAGLVAMRNFAQPRFNTIKSALRFAVAAAISPSLFGAFLAYLLTWATGGNAPATGLHWFFANVLGVCILFPFGMTVSLHQFAKLHLERRFLEAMAVFLLLGAVTILGFRLSSYPLQFLILAAALLSTARFRLMGAGMAMMVITVIALASPEPFQIVNMVPRVEILQLFLAVTSLLCVRAAVVLNERDMHMALVERRRRQAVRASRFKSQLLSHVNHEVRGPLSAIIGFSGMLESGTLPLDRAHEFAHVIGHNGELLQRLHDDLLDLARAEAGALSIISERVPVEATLKTCISGIHLESALGGKPVVLEEMDENLAVSADPMRLAQIINNLIANAYKYGDNFSPIHVRARRLEGGYGRIEIANSGPGILSHERATLFRPFARLDTGRNVPGAGLGLSIAKLLVEKQGGRIDFESIPGRQTRFWIDLPLVA